ncbi:MAG: hypothetical protein CHACPFDD_01880 [Phycisphaerae bacterium]|nr:hypothetical protein [Phycisphaerae bacterium]
MNAPKTRTPRVRLRPLRLALPLCLAGLLASAAAAQTTSAPRTPLQREPGARWLAVGVLMGDAREAWRADSLRRLRGYARNYPTLRIEVLDAGGDVRRQCDQLTSMLERHFDAVLISPLDVDALGDLLERAASAAIPIVLMDRTIDRPPAGVRCVVAPDDILVGRAAARAALDLPRTGGDGRTTILELTGDDDDRTRKLSAGLREGLQGAAGVQLAAAVNAHGKQDAAHAATLEALTSGPVNLIVAHSDLMARGAQLALKSAGKDAAVPVVGIGGLPDEGERWVRSGELRACVVYPTCGQPALDAALAALSNRPLERRISPLVRIITKADVERGGKPLRMRGGG